HARDGCRRCPRNVGSRDRPARVAAADRQNPGRSRLTAGATLYLARALAMPRSRSPLTAETISPLNAPPVRLGLQTKLNLLAIGLIVVTALGVTAFLTSKQVQDEQARLRAQGLTTAAMLAEVADD